MTTLVCVLLSLFAKRIYRADLNLVYGKEMKKLKMLIKHFREIEGGC